MTKYEKYDWEELPAEAKAAGELLCLDAHATYLLCTKILMLMREHYQYLTSISPMYNCYTFLVAHVMSASVLGFNQQLWDADDEPDTCDEWWKDLTPAQQQAATVLGYTEKSWDK